VTDLPPKRTTAAENPLAGLAAAQVHLQVPRRISVRLTDTSRLALTDIGALFFTVFLSLAIGFGTTYFSSAAPRSGTLKAEFLGWVALASLNLLVLLVARYKLYTEPREVVTYRMDQGTPLTVDASPVGQESK
jgi:hypothetical protein